MDPPLDIPSKVKTERDSNDNLQELLFSVDIKVEKEAETNDDEDWCMENFAGDLLEPLFFKQVREPQGIQCALCYGYYSDRYDIYKHNLTHLQVTIINPKFFRCDICDSYFDNIKSIECHMPVHNKSITNTLLYKPKAYKPYDETHSDLILKDCNKINTFQNKPSFTKTNYEEYKTVKQLRDGMTNSLAYKPKKGTPTKVSDMPHQCDICHKTYKYKAWHEHMRTVHVVGKYTCEICDMVFKCKQYLNKHLQKHFGKRKPNRSTKMDIKCDQCDKILQSSPALKTHKRNVHSESKYVCNICKSTLKCKSYLLTHMLRVHSDDGKKHECECGKSFRSHRYLMVHKRNAHVKKKNDKKKVKVEVS